MGEEFLMSVPKLGPEHYVAALVKEYMDRYLTKHRKDILKYVSGNASYSHLNEFSRLVRVYIEDHLKSSYIEYMEAVAEALDGDKTKEEDLQKADSIIMSALKEHHLVKWYRTTK